MSNTPSTPQLSSFRRSKQVPLGYGQFPYLIIRMQAAVYMQVPIQVEAPDPGAAKKPGILISNISAQDIVKDQLILFKYRENGVSRTVEARLVCYIDPQSGEILEFITNLKGLDAVTVALLYKNRWVIEVLFKQIKQSFELKYFLSDSENGIKIQIWMALILNLLFTVLHRRINEAEDFSTMVMVAAKKICSYVSLERFLRHSETYCKRIFQKYKQKV